MMRLLLASTLLLPLPAAAQMASVAPAPVAAVPAPLAAAPTVAPAVWRNPAADYITLGQDESGYRSWYAASRRHAAGVDGFNAYLTQWGVSGIVPTWQLLRTATSWHRCGGMPFEVPPVSEWPHIVQTLRYINDYVIPAVGPVEPVSAYRNPTLNACAGGAPESAHKHYSAVDLVPLTQTTREQLMRRLCTAHARRGTAYEVGLGFYSFLRFHVDTTKYRRWGADSDHATCPPMIRPVQVASAPQSSAISQTAATAAKAAAAAPAADPISAVQDATPTALIAAPTVQLTVPATSPTPAGLDPLAPKPVQLTPAVPSATVPAPVLQTDASER